MQGIASFLLAAGALACGGLRGGGWRGVFRVRLQATRPGAALARRSPVWPRLRVTTERLPKVVPDGPLCYRMARAPPSCHGFPGLLDAACARPSSTE